MWDGRLCLWDIKIAWKYEIYSWKFNKCTVCYTCEYACNFYLMEMGKYPYLKIQYKSMETYFD